MSDNFLRSVVEGMGDGVVVVDAAGAVIFANDSARRLFGSGPDAPLQAVLGGDQVSWHSADGRVLERSEHPLFGALAGSRCESQELVWRGADRADVWMSVSARALDLGEGRRGAMATFRDVTNVRRLGRDLQTNSLLYGALARNLPGGAAFLFDTDLHVVAAHGEEVLATAGVRSREIVGKHVLDVVQSPNRDAIADLYRATIAGESRTLEITARDRSYAVHSVPVRDDAGTIVAGLAVSYDVTQHKRDAAEMRAMTAKISALVDHVSTGVLFADSSNRVQLVNRAFCKFFGFAGPAEIVGSDALDDQRIPVLDREGFRRLRQRRMKEGVTALSDRIELTDGRVLERDYVPVDVEGVVEGHCWCFRDVTERERARAQLAELSNRDELTALYNRRGFITLAEQWLRIAARTRRTPLLLFVDVNGMKPINDRLGHAEGDRVLRDTADLLRLTFRESDILARLGGDEFVVLAVDALAEHVTLLVDRLQRNVKTLNETVHRPYRVSLSVGVSAWDPAKPRSVEELLAEADARMYEAKRRRLSSSTIRAVSGV